VLVAGTACNNVTGLNNFSVSDKPSSARECETHKECSDRATAQSMDGSPVVARCVQPEGRCVTLLTDECTTLTGDASDEDSLLLGSLFATTGATGATNTQRQQSVLLAVNEINAVGGIPSADGSPRKLVMLSCNSASSLKNASGHLVDELHVPAIIGPNTSQDTLDVSNQVTVPGGTLVISPSAVASSITSLPDKDLTWLMVPTDVQRAPLMIEQINELETQLKRDRSLNAVKLGIVFRDDALGKGTRQSLDSLVINGKPIADSSNFGHNVLIDGYDSTAKDQEPIVSKYLVFAPDIVVLAGTAEAITAVMKPLEERWSAETTRRPYYVLIDSVKVPDLITLATNNDDLRKRVRGTGVTSGPDSASVFNSFKLDYQVAYPGSSTSASGIGPAYDATYAVAFAIAYSGNQEVTGASVARGLRHLGKGTTEIDVTPNKATLAFQKLSAGTDIRAMGTFGPLDWDMDGNINGGTIEMWCIGGTTATPAYQSSGLSLSIMSQMISGTYTQCGQ